MDENKKHDDLPCLQQPEESPSSLTTSEEVPSEDSAKPSLEDAPQPLSDEAAPADDCSNEANEQPKEQIETDNLKADYTTEYLFSLPEEEKTNTKDPKTSMGTIALAYLVVLLTVILALKAIPRNDTPADKTTAKAPAFLPGQKQDNGSTIPDYPACPAPLSPKEAQTALEAMIARVKDQVVSITAAGYDGGGAGSGIILTQDGYIATNAHVVANNGQIIVTLADGHEYKADVVGTDEKTDLAVLKIKPDAGIVLHPATLETSPARLGQSVAVIGNVLGAYPGSVSTGVVSFPERTIELDGRKINGIQFSAPVSPGNSGGGMFDLDGGLIGMVTAKSGRESAEGVGFAIPARVIKDITTDLIKYGIVVNRPTLGVTVGTYQPSQSVEGELLGLHGLDAGVYILTVSENSAAHKAGLLPRDRIAAVDGTAINDAAVLADMIAKAKIGQVLKMTIVRSQEEMEVMVQLQKNEDTKVLNPDLPANSVPVS